MLTFLNRHFRFLLVLILVLIGVSFIFFGSWTPRGGGMGNETLGKINGRKIGPADLILAEKENRVLEALNTGQISNQSDEAALTRAWMRLVLLNAVGKAGIRVAEEDVIEHIRSHPLFSSEEGNYEPARFERFLQNFLTPQGVSMSRFQEILQHELAIERFMEQFKNTVIVTPAQQEKMLNELFGTAHASAVEFSLKQVEQTIKPDEDALQEFYRAHLRLYMNPEQRVVEYASFQLSPEEQKLPDGERSARLAELNEQAYEFTGLFIGVAEEEQPDFREAAKESGVEIKTATLAPGDKLLPKFDQPELTQVAFELDPQMPFSDFLPVEDGFIVLRLVEIKPALPKPFDEVKTAVREDYVQQKAREELLKTGEEFRQNAYAKLKEGLSWNQAVRELDEKAVDVPPFVPAEKKPSKVNAPDTVRYLAKQISPGQISRLEMTPEGAVLVYLEKRLSPEGEKRAELMPKIEYTLGRQYQSQLFHDWLVSQMILPGTQIPAGVLQTVGY